MSTIPAGGIEEAAVGARLRQLAIPGLPGRRRSSNRGFEMSRVGRFG
jgi:hypothetical protein